METILFISAIIIVIISNLAAIVLATYLAAKVANYLNVDISNHLLYKLGSNITENFNQIEKDSGDLRPLLYLIIVPISNIPVFLLMIYLYKKRKNN